MELKHSEGKFVETWRSVQGAVHELSVGHCQSFLSVSLARYITQRHSTDIYEQHELNMKAVKAFPIKLSLSCLLQNFKSMTFSQGGAKAISLNWNLCWWKHFPPTLFFISALIIIPAMALEKGNVFHLLGSSLSAEIFINLKAYERLQQAKSWSRSAIPGGLAINGKTFSRLKIFLQLSEQIISYFLHCRNTIKLNSRNKAGCSSRHTNKSRQKNEITFRHADSWRQRKSREKKIAEWLESFHRKRYLKDS